MRSSDLRGRSGSVFTIFLRSDQVRDRVARMRKNSWERKSIGPIHTWLVEAGGESAHSVDWLTQPCRSLSRTNRSRGILCAGSHSRRTQGCR